jgi:hypothetical protein
MAELVGLVASVVQLVNTFTKGVKLMKDLHNAPKEQLQLFSEIQSLEPFIVALQGRVQTTGGMMGIKNLQDPLLQLDAVMKRCNKKLEKNRPFTGAISWTLWNKEEAKEDLESIEHFKTLLNSWLAVDIWCGSTASSW